MCLVVKEGKSIEIADRDIHCFKRVEKSREDKWTGLIHNDRLYEFNKMVTAEKITVWKIGELKYKQLQNLSIVSDKQYKFIYEGFHAYVVNRHLLNYNHCIIPKGTKICYGDANDIVAVNMIVFKNLFQYLKYKLKSIFKTK